MHPTLVRPRLLVVDSDPTRAAILEEALREADVSVVHETGDRRLRVAHLPHAILLSGDATLDEPVLAGVTRLRIRHFPEHIDRWPAHVEEEIARKVIDACLAARLEESFGPPDGKPIRGSWHLLRSLVGRRGAWRVQIDGPRSAVLELSQGRVHAAHISIALAALRHLRESTVVIVPITQLELPDVGTVRSLAVELGAPRSGLRLVPSGTLEALREDEETG